jgi:hypothetical protein
MRRASSLAFALLLLGCGSSAPTGTGGAGGTSSGTGASTTGTGGSGGTGPCPDVPCDGSQVCVAGACLADCRQPAAVPCSGGLVCDASDAHPGQCVDPGTACVTSSAPEPCGGKVCGPGSACDGHGKCYARVPCGSVTCDDLGCWGVACACTRGLGCTPAPLGLPGDVGTLQDDAFRKGIVDLEFDPMCTAWGVTMLSGPDYLRSVGPDGTVSSIAGVTNLNMGEVSALQRLSVPTSATFPQPFDAPGLDVALTYICCATCGCQINGSTPQGVSHLDPLTKDLPLVIPSQQFTTGTGPFHSDVLDTGPEGLTYGTDRVLYVGNVNVNGDYYSLDLASKVQTLVTTFAARVYASTPFDAVSMLVALENDEIRLLRLTDATSTLWATSDQPVTGVVRDFFDGTVYVARNDGTVWRYDDQGTGALWQTLPDRARLTLAPDGYLYALEIPQNVVAGLPVIERFPLPLTR